MLGDFLCTQTYAFNLAGNWKKGEDFTIEFNQLNSFYEDEYSWFQNMSEERKEQVEYWISHDIGDFSGSYDTTIYFSNDKWEWYNSENELINNGKYQESDKYPGLIAMYVNDESKNAIDAPTVLVFFIFEGKVYYPAFVKA